MNHLHTWNRLLGMFMIPILAIAALITLYSFTLTSNHHPLARQGVLDLTDWDFHQGGLVGLNGEWEFYKGQLLEPNDFQSGHPAGKGYLQVPGVWKSSSASGGMDYRGFGTYRLKVKLASSEDVFGIKTNKIRMAHRLYINGVLQGQSGIPAVDAFHHEPGNTPYIKYFQVDQPELEIVVQVANYVFINGGIVNELKFGLQEDISRLSMVLFGTDLAGVFILLLFSIYHFSIYSLRMQDKTYLYTGIFFITIMLILVLSGEKLALRIFPAIPFEIAYKLNSLVGFSATMVLGIFLNALNPRLLTRRMLYALNLPIVIFCACIVVLPYAVYTNAELGFWIYSMLLLVFYLGRAIYLYVKRVGDPLQLKELLLLVGVIGSLVFFMFDSLLYATNKTSTDVGGRICVLAFISFMNMLLALRFVHTYTQLELLSEQLIVRDRLKDEFLASTSHELKTPLHGIMNISAFLLDDKQEELSGKQRQNLKLIKDMSIRLATLVHDLVDVAQLKQGSLRLQLKLVDVQMLTQFVFDVLAFEMMGKEIRLVNRVPSCALAQADENRVRQILYNLVHNAIKHTQKGTIEVSSKLDGEKLYIFVEDTGSGIPRKEHEAIFGYFEQADEKRIHNGYGGMGLGLFISRQLVRRMEGDIWVDWSEVGCGTRFCFTLPSVSHVPLTERRLAGADNASPEQEKIAEQLQPDQWEQNRRAILVVDDEPSNIQILLNLLGRNYNVVTAFSAKEALEKITQVPSLALVILDVMMPGISGIELCRMLRETHSIIELPILLATVKDTPRDIEAGYTAGANDYITKPFDAGTLLARVHTLISVKALMEEALHNEMAYLQAQIKPHFLYNALSSIISFCYTDGKRAAHLLTMLSRYLRHIFERDRASMLVPLKKELELIQAYVEIERARFGERFEFRLNMDEGTTDVPIPSLCIQPFVENAIRHGLFEKEEKGAVTLTVTDGVGFIRIVVEDDGVGMADDLLYQFMQGDMRHSGIGMTNIKKRLAVIAGASVTVDSALEQGTKVTVYLPKSYAGRIPDAR